MDATMHAETEHVRNQDLAKVVQLRERPLLKSINTRNPMTVSESINVHVTNHCGTDLQIQLFNVQASAAKAVNAGKRHVDGTINKAFVQKCQGNSSESTS